MDRQVKIERVGMSHGLKCVVIGIPNMHRCGYVGVRPGSLLYGKHYDEVPADVHGGLMYCGGSDECPVAGKEWWFGFDCAHYGDAPDPALRDRNYMRLSFAQPPVGHVWTQDEVVAQCESLAEQLDRMQREERFGALRTLWRRAGLWVGEIRKRFRSGNRK